MLSIVASAASVMVPASGSSFPLASSRTDAAVPAPSGRHCALPLALTASPADTVSSPLPAAASPLATRCMETPARSGRCSSAAVTPPAPSSTVISPSTVRCARSKRVSAESLPDGPSVRSPARRSRPSCRSADRRPLPCKVQRESTPASGAARCSASTDSACRSTPTGKVNEPPPVADLAFDGSGARRTSTNAACSSSTRTRPVNSEANDQLSRAFSILSHGPCSSRSSTCATCRSVGKKPPSPDTRRVSFDASPASVRWPGGVCRKPNSTPTSTSRLPSTIAAMRSARIRRPAPG